jgi:WD repeat-containing protein 89
MLARYELTCVDGYKHPSTGNDDVYVLDLMIVSNGLVTSASDQSLSLFDVQSLGQGPVQTLRTDHGNLTATRPFSGQDASVPYVCTAGENGTASVWDMRLGPSQAQVLRIATAGELRPKMRLA